MYHLVSSINKANFRLDFRYKLEFNNFYLFHPSNFKEKKITHAQIQ